MRRTSLDGAASTERLSCLAGEVQLFDGAASGRRAKYEKLDQLAQRVLSNDDAKEDPRAFSKERKPQRSSR
jgi:hypothetical protein